MMQQCVILSLCVVLALASPPMNPDVAMSRNVESLDAEVQVAADILGPHFQQLPMQQLPSEEEQQKMRLQQQQQMQMQQQQQQQLQQRQQQQMQMQQQQQMQQQLQQRQQQLEREVHDRMRLMDEEEPHGPRLLSW